MGLSKDLDHILVQNEILALNFRMKILNKILMFPKEVIFVKKTFKLDEISSVTLIFDKKLNLNNESKVSIKVFSIKILETWYIFSIIQISLSLKISSVMIYIRIYSLFIIYHYKDLRYVSSKYEIEELKTSVNVEVMLQIDRI